MSDLMWATKSGCQWEQCNEKISNLSGASESERPRVDDQKSANKSGKIKRGDVKSGQPNVMGGVKKIAGQWKGDPENRW